MNGWIPRFLSRVLQQCDGADGANLASGEPKTCFADIRPEGPNTCKKQGDSPDLASHEKVRLGFHSYKSTRADVKQCLQVVGVWLEKLPCLKH